MIGLGTLIIFGIVMYAMLSRTGGVACCGGHANHSHGRNPHRWGPEAPEAERLRSDGGQVIDLKPEDYKVVSVERK